MTDVRIHWSEMDQKYWINDNDEVLWFDSVLDLKDKLREIDTRNAVNAEVSKIVAWLRDGGPDANYTPTWLALMIEAREYKP